MLQAACSNWYVILFAAFLVWGLFHEESLALLERKALLHLKRAIRRAKKRRSAQRAISSRATASRARVCSRSAF